VERDPLTLRLSDGRTLAYTDYGDPEGAPVLYFHGIPGSRLDGTAYEPLDDELKARGVRGIAPDRPGHGGSTQQPGRRLIDWPRDVVELADSLGLERFSVLGLSAGTKFALACGAALGDRVKAVGLLATVGPPETPRFRDGLGKTALVSMTLAPRWRSLAVAYWSVARLMVTRAPGLFMHQLEAELSPTDRALLSDPEVRRLALTTSRECLRPGVQGVVDEFLIQARPWGFQLAEVRPPVRLWHGETDRLAPLWHSEHVAQSVPDGELTVLPGQGHFSIPALPEIYARLAA
jgi:pimeloyl-ACP methyl ester carboxylesterase